MTDQEAVDGYCAYLAARSRRPRTLEAYRMCLSKLIEFMAGKLLLQATASELEFFSGIWLHKRGVIARSRKPYISAVKGFYAWAHARDLVGANASRELQQPKTGRPLPDALSLASAEKLMWAPDLNTFAGIRDAAMLSILIGCGLRVSGLADLNEGSLRYDELRGKARLVLHAVEKGERERIVPVPREAEVLLQIYLRHEDLKRFDRSVTLAGGRDDKVLFVNLRNQRVPAHEYRGEAVRISRQAVWKMIQRYGDAEGIPEAERHAHAFRHLYGTELAEDDVSTTMRGELLGHVDPKTTVIYDSMSIRRKTQIVDASGPMGKIKTPVSELLKRL